MSDESSWSMHWFNPTGTQKGERDIYNSKQGPRCRARTHAPDELVGEAAVDEVLSEIVLPLLVVPVCVRIVLRE